MRISGKKYISEAGFSLIEVLVIIVVIGILAGTALNWMAVSMEDIRTIKTEREMEMLAFAITGNPSKMASGRRSDFGYIGDIGAFPTNLQALNQNPGGYATWDGPYIEPGYLQDNGFLYDEWGIAYTYSGGLTIVSSGGSAAITKKIADASTDYLINNFNGVIMDAADSVPGNIYMDSITVNVSIPNGIGTTITKNYAPDSAGLFRLDSLPVGHHPLRIIYVPNADTLYRELTVLPRNKSGRIYKFSAAYFSSGGGPMSNVELLLPSGVGSSTNLNSSGCTNWMCVDDIISDEDVTYVEGFGANWNADLYQLSDHVSGSGNIDSVIIWVCAMGDGAGDKTRTHINVGGTIFDGVQNNTTAVYADYSSIYISNPVTSLAWSWADIDALEIGVDLKKTARCTRVWAEVYYTN
jgi:type II secretory pathway pseudopilin PulG